MHRSAENSTVHNSKTAQRRHCVSLQLLCYGMLVVSLFIAYLVGWIVSGVWVSASFQRSLDDDFATLVHAFVASRVDYCGSLPNGAPRKTTNKLQRVLNTAAHIVSNTCKFDRGLTHFRRKQLHWLDVVDRVGFGSEFASRCSDVCTRWLLNTCLPTANPSPASLAVATCNRVTVAISISHV